MCFRLLRGRVGYGIRQNAFYLSRKAHLLTLCSVYSHEEDAREAHITTKTVGQHSVKVFIYLRDPGIDSTWNRIESNSNSNRGQSSTIVYE